MPDAAAPSLRDGEFFAFLDEASDSLSIVESELLALEAAGALGDVELVHAVFRAVHNIKGAAGFFALAPVSELAHDLEDVLDRLRSGQMVAGPPLVALLLEATTNLSLMLDAARTGEAIEASGTRARLRAVLEGECPPDSGPASTFDAGASCPISSGPSSSGPTSSGPTSIEISSSRRTKESTIRVSVAHLNRLMTIAGELVLARNALMKQAQARSIEGLIVDASRVDSLTTELRDGVMVTRLQPIGELLKKFPRVVRDLAADLGKRLELVVEGAAVELDRTTLEALWDPLTHLVRNACDHGLEGPAERVAAGKREIGRLTIRASQTAGQVHLELVDDGRGVDPERVRARAIARGLRDRDGLANLDDHEVTRLIFAPGFSTAEAVTDLSGRGVGLDVVVSSLARVGGTIDVHSIVGQGTTFAIRLPLTLAIVPALLVRSGSETYALPQVNVIEVVRIPPTAVRERLEHVGSATVLRLRDELLPLIHLGEELGVSPAASSALPPGVPTERRGGMPVDRRSPAAGTDVERADAERRRMPDRRAAPKAPVFVIVLEAAAARFGLVVDAVVDSEEIVVKPIGCHVREARVFAGSTVLGDGQVALILDAGILAVRVRARGRTHAEAASAGRSRRASDTHEYLLFDGATGERFALPLGAVGRIERVEVSELQAVGGRKSLVLGDSLVPLVRLSEVLRAAEPQAQAHVLALTCRAFGHLVALEATRIVDVVACDATIDEQAHVEVGVFGSLLIEGQIVRLIDLHAFVARALPELRAAASGESAKNRGTETVVLVVDDSPFFRRYLTTSLTDAGYTILAAADGAEALSLLREHEKRVELVVTDVEMPNVDGLELARRIRAQARHAALPILALTSISGGNAADRGREAGFTEYLIKMDLEDLLARVRSHTRKHATPTHAEFQP